MLLLLAWAAHAECYDWPFPNPIFGDPWGSTAGRDSPHRGLDFPMASGTSIGAIGNGSVVLSDWSSCLGWYVVIRHDDSWYSAYGHMYEQSPVSVGTYVGIGKTMGRVGTTGTCSTGPHLHLVVTDHEDGWGYGSTVDPAAFIRDHGAVTESCNNQDDDCDAVVDNTACDATVIDTQAPAYAPPTTSDIDGDGQVDVCALDSTGFRCWPSDGTSWGTPTSPVPWTTDWESPSHYATLRMGDLDGNGRADVCGRSTNGISCALSTGDGFAAPTVWKSGFSDAEGWDQPAWYASLRLADVDGDGRDDLCGREGDGLACWLSNGRSFTTTVPGPAWTEALFDQANHYGTLRTADVDGDGRQDFCARTASGLQCSLSEGSAFAAPFAGPAWKDSSGWGGVRYWSTTRLADVNGDGRADACARSSASFSCSAFNGTGFDTAVTVATMSDYSGWGDINNYLTLRMGDVDGDDRADLCARANSYALCYTNGASGVGRIDGPAWSDSSGYTAVHYYATLRVGDVDGDGREDLCVRASAGWRCQPSTGSSFGDPLISDAVADATGGNQQSQWGSILFGGRSCGVRPDEPCPDFPEPGDSGDPENPGNGQEDTGVHWQVRALDALESGGCAFVPGGGSAATLLALLALRRRRA